ncbi:MAG: hypothetical protein AVDCRST_MAG61-266, partial [uncultured Friedmanniella sp.]
GHHPPVPHPRFRGRHAARRRDGRPPRAVGGPRGPARDL